jgi:hypothetical protein
VTHGHQKVTSGIALHNQLATQMHFEPPFWTGERAFALIS